MCFTMAPIMVFMVSLVVIISGASKQANEVKYETTTEEWLKEHQVDFNIPMQNFMVMNGGNELKTQIHDKIWTQALAESNKRRRVL